MISNTGDILLQAKKVIENHLWYLDNLGDYRKDRWLIDEAEAVLELINAWEAGKNHDAA